MTGDIGDFLMAGDGNGIDVLRERLRNHLDRFDAHVDAEEANGIRIAEALDKNDEDHKDLKTEITDVGTKIVENAAGVDKLYALNKWAWLTVAFAFPLLTGLLVYIFKTHSHGVTP